MKWRIGIDVGGTFTDILAVNDTGKFYTLKVPSTPHDPPSSFIDGLKMLSERQGIVADDINVILHGTTIATNAIVERKYPPIGLITTDGFRNVLEIARQTVPGEWGAIYSWVKPPSIVPIENIREVSERTSSEGLVRKEIDRKEINDAVDFFKSQGLRSIAVSLMNSYANPENEESIKKIIEDISPESRVTISSEIIREFKEYERTITTCMNAALIPVLSEYVNEIIRRLRELRIEAPVLMMKSSGGLVGAKQAISEPLSMASSGPSAGALGMAWLAKKAGHSNVITLDMGGTTTLVCLVEDSKPSMTMESVIDVYPIRLPTIEIVTIGSGGGSIIWYDSVKRIKVGPKSAAADPGPVCYEKGGTSPTVTDAHLVLGRIPNHLIGGSMKLSRAKAEAVLSKFGGEVGLDAYEMAHGIIEITCHNMADAVRQVTTQRGRDPRDYILTAFGGAGPMHVGRIMEILGIQKTLIPPSPGMGCSSGLLIADIKTDSVMTEVQREGTMEIKKMAEGFAILEEKALDSVKDQGLTVNKTLSIRSADMRYIGQGSDLTVEVPNGLFDKSRLNRMLDNFHERHHDAYGYSYKGEQIVEVVNLRVTAYANLPKYNIALLNSGNPNPSQIKKEARPVYFAKEDGFRDCSIQDRERLKSGDIVKGPAIIEQYDSTTVIQPEMLVKVDDLGNLIMVRE